MHFRLFGEVQLQAADQLLDLGTPRQQAVLAALIVDAGRPVTIEMIIDRVWDDTPPIKARNVLYSHLSRIRQLLKQAATLAGEPAVRIERRHAGYVLVVDPDRVDLLRFRDLVEHGRDPGRSDAARLVGLSEALDLWRGTPLAALRGEWATEVRDSWHRLRIDAVVLWAQLELRRGNPVEVINVMHGLISEYPLVEPLEGLLMRALHVAGRSAEAIDRYAELRRRLADNLGADPGPELSAVHQAILRGEQPPSPQNGNAAETTRTVARPAQLPPDLHGFTGRDTELRQLDEVLVRAGDRSTALVISAVSGTAGVGKTALAVHWAHRRRDRFPDGQLYVNLDGYALGTPLLAEHALARILRAMGVPHDQVPIDLAELSGMYRSVLGDQRMLVVLDNAGSAEQVRPLLPGGPGCLVLITSRDRLDGLIAKNGARRLTLDVLPLDEAVELLARIVGAARVSTEPDAAAELARTCACLPLALRIAAAQLANHPGRRIDEHLTELRRGDLLTALDVEGDQQSAVRVAFDCSYAALKPETQRMFRLLGLVPGPDITGQSAAAVTGSPPTVAARLLDRLAAAHLLDQHAPGRYSMHDLLRQYATEQAHDHDSDAERDTALNRLLHHYLGWADAAGRTLNRFTLRLPIPPPVPDIPQAEFHDRDDAWAWMDSEQSNMVAAVHHANQHGPRQMVWLLADVLLNGFLGGRQFNDWFAVARMALAAAEAANEPRAQAAARVNLGLAYDCRGQHTRALEHFNSAVGLFRATGWLQGEAATLAVIGLIHRVLGDLQGALDHVTRARTLCHQVAIPYQHANTLTILGSIHVALGQLDHAGALYHEALAISREIGNRRREASALYHLSCLAYVKGDLTRALDLSTESITICRDLGDIPFQAEILTNLADIHRDAGRHRQALDDARSAVAIASDRTDRLAQAGAHNALAATHSALGNHREATEHYGHALSIATDIAARYEEGCALVGLATTNPNAGDALTLAHHALTIARGTGYRLLEAQALDCIATIHLTTGNFDKAIDNAELALAIHRETGQRLNEARTLRTVGSAKLKTRPL